METDHTKHYPTPEEVLSQISGDGHSSQECYELQMRALSDAFEELQDERERYTHRGASTALLTHLDGLIDAFEQAIDELAVERCREEEQEGAGERRETARRHRKPRGPKPAERRAPFDLTPKLVSWFRRIGRDPSRYPFEADARVQAWMAVLQQWTAKPRAVLVYDSLVDDFTDDGLFTSVRNVERIALVAMTTDGDVFGGFFSRAVSRQEVCSYDPSVFAFAFEAHGRCATPQRFAVLPEKRSRAFVYVYHHAVDGQFVMFGADVGCGFSLGNELSRTICMRLPEGFERLEDAVFSGGNDDGRGNPFFICERLLAMHLF